MSLQQSGDRLRLKIPVFVAIVPTYLMVALGITHIVCNTVIPNRGAEAHKSA